MFVSTGSLTKLDRFSRRVNAVYRVEFDSIQQNKSIEDLLMNSGNSNKQTYQFTSYEWYQWFRSKVPKNVNPTLPQSETIPDCEPKTDFNGNPYVDALFLSRQAQVIDCWNCAHWRPNKNIESVIAEMQHLPGSVSVEWFRWYKNAKQ